MARRRHAGVVTSCARDEAGSTLVEALVATAMMGFVMLSIAQLIGVSVLAHKASEEVTEVTAIAEHKLEELRNMDYDLMVAGGSVVADVAPFFETTDIDGDGNDDYLCRWQVTDNGPSKNVTVFAQAIRTEIGQAKGATLFALVAER